MECAILRLEHVYVMLDTWEIIVNARDVLDMDGQTLIMAVRASVELDILDQIVVHALPQISKVMHMFV
jgi:hypothetical protein